MKRQKDFLEIYIQLDLQSISLMDSNQKILLAILITVCCLQGLHFASAGTAIDYYHKLDHRNGRSQTAWNSSYKKNSYKIIFSLTVASSTLFLYCLLLIGRYTSLRLGEKAQEIVYALVAAMQFALGVLLAIDQSRQIDPYGPNATPITVESFYRDFFNTQLADTVLIWVLCIPGSYLLVHYHAMTGYGKEKDNQMGVTA